MTLPNMLIAGAPRCGTTSIYRGLAIHPDIFFPEKKELWFFYNQKEWQKGIEWYADQFKGHVNEKIIAEATPLYFCCQKSIKRISRVLPGVKILLVLRNPVDRAVSHYWFNVKKSNESLSIDEALERDLSESREWKLPKGALNYVGIGMYDVHIQNILRYFKRNQVHTVIFEEMLNNQEKTFVEIYDFLGVQWKSVNSLKKENGGEWFRSVGMKKLYADFPLKRVIVGLLPTGVQVLLRKVRGKLACQSSPPELSCVIKKRLISVYDKHIANLELFLQKDLSFWREQ